MLQVARGAARYLADSTPLVRERLHCPLRENGWATDRSGKPDVYYTVFALAGLEALEVAWAHDSVAPFLRGYGDGAGLDFVHVGALARCWAFVGLEAMPAGAKSALVSRLEAFRKPDGGYEADPRLSHGTAYGAFVALGAYQDLGERLPHPLDLARSLQGLRSRDGAWSNVPGAPCGATNATAGAVVLLRHLGLPASQELGDWLMARAHPQGGFLASPEAPMPDLLSTATALHALAALDRRIPSEVHERCLDFIDSLWSAEGGFHGHWADDHLDPEYTFYGLLALGHLAL
jgi:prenyltransferase beta subunit